jgi:hypothetical protein
MKVDECISILRNRRDSYLNASDWSMTVDLIELKGQQWKNKWSAYRQSLRDITQEYIERNEVFDPFQVEFPGVPE